MKISKLTLATSAAALVVGAALVLTGCSAGGSAGTSKKDSGSGTSNSQSGSGRGQDGQGGAGGFGGAAGGGTIGTIADVTGSTLQVQSSSDQTAVTFSSSTAITQTVSVALSAVKVGDCVVATTTPASASTGSSSSSDAGDGPVTSVAISEPVNGACTGGFGGRGGAGLTGGSGQRPSGLPTDRPRSTDRPSNRPSGGSGRDFANGGAFALPTSGKVTAVSGSTITVDALDFQTQKTASKAVTVDSATKYTESQKAAASALAVGQCVVAQGKADDSGTVAATSIAVSAPVDGSCTSGFGFRGTRPNGGTGSGSGDANGAVNG